MTEQKPKYNYWNYLIWTQMVEIYTAETPTQRAKEQADLIHILIRDMERAGYNPAEVYEKRTDEKIKLFKEIVTKYKNKWKDILEEMEKENGD